MRRLGVAAALVDGVLVRGDVGVVGAAIEAVGLPPARSGLAVPGFVDLQVNGFAGVDFLTADAESFAVAARAMARGGVTAYAANVISSPEHLVSAALGTARRVASASPPGGARLLGVHLEGPFLAASRAGAHAREHLRTPDVSLVQTWLTQGPVVGMTLAPELPGALEVVRRLAGSGLLVALGHSEASAAEANAGFDAGARTVTHVFNAMSAPTAREPGLAGVALVRPDVAVQLICDGVHLAPETAALVLAAARDRFIVVTDSVAATGLPEGEHVLGGAPVVVRGGAVRRPGGTLAGSLVTMAGAVRHAVAAGASVEDAVAAATTRPAALIGRSDLGRVRPGDVADVVVLDDALAVRSVLLAGRQVP